MGTSPDRRAWILPVLLAAVLAGVFAVRAWMPASPSAWRGIGSPDAELDSSNSEDWVTLTVDFGDGTSQEFRVPWRNEMTVQDAFSTQDAEKLLVGGQGSGPGALLTELGGVANEGAGGRNWQFEVNGQWSDRSFGIFKLRPGDHVLWKFAASE